MKNQVKPEIIREFSLILMEVRENKLCSSHISFINSYMVVRKVVVLFVVSKCELEHSPYCYSKFLYINYLQGSILFTCFCKSVKLWSGKKWVFLTMSQGKVRE